jgi:pimeloyl-ACP methyl ester carboxylesterase
MRKFSACLLVFFCGNLVYSQSHVGRFGEVTGLLFSESELPEAPNYENEESWSARPGLCSPADTLPGWDWPLAQGNAAVFWVSPTLYTGASKSPYHWNVDFRADWFQELHKEGPLMHQASVFNLAGRIYAPYYRQAHLYSFFDQSPETGKAALDTAYSDVRRAFLYFMENLREDRPIILAGHSQGSYHIARLLKEFFDSQDLQKALVAAYIPGMPIPSSLFSTLTICQNETETGCILTWSTYARGYLPDSIAWKDMLAVNPLSWKTDQSWVPRKSNPGSILWRYGKVKKGICDAQLTTGALWIRKPRFLGNIFFRWKDYHIADYNLFYMSVRKNALARLMAFKERSSVGD